MKCAWKELLAILPPAIREEVNRQGKDTLQELRMRLGQNAELVTISGFRWLERKVVLDDLLFTVNSASRYSPWSAATAAYGYITAPGGHRIGMCGECVVKDGVMTGIRNLSSLCIRVARDFPDISIGVPAKRGSVLILGPPGSGKTTLLRDLIRRISDAGRGSIAVVDERGEIFPPGAGFAPGKRTDILTGCSKAAGIESLLRTMGPACIAVDEITSETDCAALLKAGWCGVDLIATAHASNAGDLMSRPVYRPLVEKRLFETILTLRQDKSWTVERMKI